MAKHTSCWFWFCCFFWFCPCLPFYLLYLKFCKKKKTRNVERAKQTCCCWFVLYIFLCPCLPFYLLYLRFCKRNSRPTGRRSCCESLCWVTRPSARNLKPRIYSTKTWSSEGFSSIFYNFIACCNVWCCCFVSFVKGMELKDAIGRYEEFAPKTQPKELIEEISRNEFLSFILEYLNTKKPGFYFRVLPSGSIREGFGYALPSTSVLATDYDLMLVPDAIYAYDEFTQRSDVFPISFEAVDDPNQNPDRPKGFLWLKRKQDLKAWQDLCYEKLTPNGVEEFLSQLAVMEMIREEIGTWGFLNLFQLVFGLRDSIEEKYLVVATRTGPALNITITKKKLDRQRLCCPDAGNDDGEEEEILNVDFTLAISCPVFPRDGEYFFERRNQNDFYQRENQNEMIRWPSQTVIDKIRHLGCHVVPKPSEKFLSKFQEEQMENSYLGASCVLEWRYSFSQAEMLLSDEIPQQARTAYLAFKATIKAHINYKVDSPDSNPQFHNIPSYALKTILFYEVEKKPLEYWEPEVPEDLPVHTRFFEVLMQSLLENVKNRSCPHYWIESLNLFEDMTNSDFEFFESRLTNMQRDYVSYVASDQVEFNRFVRLNCSCCVEKGVDYEFAEEDEPSGCHCCTLSLPCNREQVTPINYDPIAYQVY